MRRMHRFGGSMRPWPTALRRRGRFQEVLFPISVWLPGKRKTQKEKKRQKTKQRTEMGSLGTMLKHPDDVYPLLKLKMAVRHAEKQIPSEPHWGFCYTMLHKVSRSFALVIQQLDTDLRNAVTCLSLSLSPYVLLLQFIYINIYIHVYNLILAAVHW